MLRQHIPGGKQSAIQGAVVLDSGIRIVNKDVLDGQFHLKVSRQTTRSQKLATRFPYILQEKDEAGYQYTESWNHRQMRIALRWVAQVAIVMVRWTEADWVALRRLW